MKTKRIERQKREKERIHFFSFSLDFARLGYSNMPLRPTLSAFPLAWSWTYCLRSIRTFCLIRTARWSALLPFPSTPIFPFFPFLDYRLYANFHRSNSFACTRFSIPLFFSSIIYVCLHWNFYTVSYYLNISFLVSPIIFISTT